MRAACIALAVVAALPGAAEQVTLDRATRTRAGIVVGQVAEHRFGDQLRVVGQVVRSPGSTSTVKTVLPGKVEAVAAAPGDQVSRGQVLVRLHSHELLRLQADLLRANERHRLARTRAQAGQELYELDGISRLELEAREQVVFSAGLDVDSLRAEILDLGFTREAVAEMLSSRTTDPHLRVRSPMDAVVLELLVEEHEWVQEYAPLLVLGDPKRVELVLQIPPGQAADVGAGDRVEFVPVGHPQRTAWATVITRVPQVDPTTRTVRIRARIDDGTGSLFPGVFVEGTLSHGAVRQAPTVPESAVTRVGSSDVVFVRTGDGVFDLRPVRLGGSGGAGYEVVEGVDVGEEIVVEGVFFLKSALLHEGE